MDLKHIVLLALQISIVATVLGFGLQATAADLLYLLRRPGLLARAVLAVLLIMPLVAVALVRLFDFPHAVEIVLISLAISPVPPLLPQRETKAGGATPFALGLMAILALVSIAAVPLSVDIAGRYFNRPLGIPPSAIAALILKAALGPLAVGMIIRAFFPAAAQRLAKIATLIAKVLLPLAVVLLLAGTYSAIWTVMGTSTVLALTIFIIIGLAVGHVLGGPDPDHAVVVALSTACRHPAIALTIAATNFPDMRFGPIILLYVILNAVVAIPYVTWQKGRLAQSRVSSSRV